MKNKTLIITLIVAAVIAFWGIGRYNVMASTQENVEQAWADVENQYQRRSDLIPNLLEAVRGYTKHESQTLEAVVAARAKATQVTIDPTTATPEQLKAYQDAQGELGRALGRLLAVSEAYPDLKANENFQQLMSQLEGTENRITVARDRFNEETKQFNKLIVTFPNNLIANFGGFSKKPYFEADAEAQKAPKISFD